MAQIISASRRTDLPAFYPEWTYRRFREGTVVVKNPFNPSQVSIISLLPEDVLGIVFWTRYFRPFERYLPFFTENYEFYIHYTLTNYPRVFEPFNPPAEKVLENIALLSEKIGRERIIWRYDPIFFTGRLTPDWHMENFAFLYEKLKNYIGEIYIAALFPYKKTLKNLKKIGEEPVLRDDWFIEVGSFIKKTSSLPTYSCASPIFAISGITPGSCVNKEKFLKLLQDPAKKEELKKIRRNSTRAGCGCYESKDVGMYNTCLFGCVYCYATSSRESALKNYRRHNPESPTLIP